MIKLLTNKLFIVVFIIYVATFVLAYLNPMQSDDFSFYFMGLSVREHWYFYMTWSGRVIVDYMSTLILAINHHVIIALISSLALPLLIYNIATIPYYQEKIKNQKLLVFTLVILWCAYWLSNPALGQTTFWVVGAANYLWPLVFVSLLFKYLLKSLYSQKVSKVIIASLVILSVLSGCSNEATGALVLYCLVLLYLWAWFHRLANRHVLLICFTIVFLSYLVLLLAPGNMVRATHPEYALWRSMTFDERIYNHFRYVIPGILKNYGVIYLLLAWAFAQSYRFIERVNSQLVIIWLSATVIFSIILIASPHAGLPRSHLTGLFFLLLALSFLLKEALQQKISRLGYILLGIFYLMALVSYSLMFLAYLSIYKQNYVRIDMLEKAKVRGEQPVVIPNYYKGFVLREGDFPELDYHNAQMMGRYYGVKVVNLAFVGFDYAALLNEPCETSYSLLDSRIQCIYAQKILGADSLQFVVEFAPSIKRKEREIGYFKLTVKNTLSPSDSNYYEITAPLRVIQVKDRYFASFDTLSSLLGVRQNPELIVSVYDSNKSMLKDGKLPFVSIQVK